MKETLICILRIIFWLIYISLSFGLEAHNCSQLLNQKEQKSLMPCPTGHSLCKKTYASFFVSFLLLRTKHFLFFYLWKKSVILLRGKEGEPCMREAHDQALRACMHAFKIFDKGYKLRMIKRCLCPLSKILKACMHAKKNEQTAFFFKLRFSCFTSFLVKKKSKKTKKKVKKPKKKVKKLKKKSKN